MSVEGVDYAWARPTVAGLVAAGKHFACRYGGPGSLGKQLDPAEAQALNAAGIAIVANAEGAANGLQGFAAGADWARSADVHFRSCGMPPDRPIYLSADFDVTAAQWPTVAAALRGAASVIGAGRVGVYGGYDVMVWSRRDGVAAWRWQTYAWSEGRWAPGNHIEQYKNGVSLAGGTVDLDRALTADYGQWGVDDMGLTESEHYIQHVMNWRIAGIIIMQDPVTSPAWTAPSGKIYPATSTPNSLAKAVLAGAAAELTPAQLAAIAAAAEAGAAAGAPSVDEIAAVVDRELDEQSLGGADQD